VPEQTKPIRFANASFKLQPIEDGARYVRHFPYIHNLIGHMAKPFPEKLCVGSQLKGKICIGRIKTLVASRSRLGTRASNAPTVAWAAPSADMSRASAKALEPADLTVSSSSDWVRDTQSTVVPNAASRWAIARPIPRPAPVPLGRTGASAPSNIHVFWDG
jgi:hypothetical protein